MQESIVFLVRVQCRRKESSCSLSWWVSCYYCYYYYHYYYRRWISFGMLTQTSVFALLHVARSWIGDKRWYFLQHWHLCRPSLSDSSLPRRKRKSSIRLRPKRNSVIFIICLISCCTMRNWHFCLCFSVYWFQDFGSLMGWNLNLNAATCVVSGTHKFDRGLSRLLHTELHWLNVPERVAFKLGLMVFNCLHNQAPQYLVDLCQSVSSVAYRQHLRSANRGLLVVPRYRSAVTVGGLFLWPALRYGTGYQTVWETRPSAETPSDVHWRSFYFQLTCVHSALELSGRCALQIYLLTYFPFTVAYATDYD